MFTLYILKAEASSDNTWICFKEDTTGRQRTTSPSRPPLPLKQGFSLSPACCSLVGSWHLGNSLLLAGALDPCSGMQSLTFAVSSFFFFLL